jgi:hypothetical protein
MNTINLVTLNSLRAQNGKAPLKSWKESKSKLEAAILSEKNVIAAKAVDHAKMEEQRVARLRQEQLEASAKAAREKAEADAKALKEAEAKLPKPQPRKVSKPVSLQELQKALAKTDKQPRKLPAKPAAKASSEASIAAERLGITAKAVRAKLRKLGHSAGHGLSADQIVKALRA